MYIFFVIYKVYFFINQEPRPWQSCPSHILLLKVYLSLVLHPATFVSQFSIISHCFPWLGLPMIIPVVTRCFNFFHLITFHPKKISWLSCLQCRGDLVVLAPLNTVINSPFHLISLPSMKFIEFFLGTAFLLPPISFVSY